MKNTPCWIALLGIAGGALYLLNKQEAPGQIGGGVVSVSTGNGFSSSSSSSFISTGNSDDSQIGGVILAAIVAVFAIAMFSKDKS